MKQPLLEDSIDHVTELAVSSTGLKLHAVDSVMVVTRGMILAHTFPVARNTVPVTINQDMKALRARPGVDTRYLAWMMKGMESLMLSLTDESAHGTKTLRTDQWEDLRVPMPLPGQQERIANFLDEQTARIDSLIAEKERLVKSLGELRKATIYALITGTRSDLGVQTGNRYFPRLARGWRFTKVKYIAASLDGRRIPLNGEERATRQGEFAYYGASGPIDSIDAYIFDEPLVLVGEDGANLLNRATPLAFVAEGKYWVNNHAHILRPLDGQVNLWARVIDALDVTEWVTGSAQPKLTIDALMNLPVPEIPLALRDTLAADIAREESKINGLKAHSVEHIDRLREYRSSLISAAVTGQLDISTFKVAA
jgi:type I restriction enzyme S subunit